MPKPIADIYMYRRFSTAEEYFATTGVPVVWDPTKRPKYWFDPKAANAPRRNVVYDCVLAIADSGTIISDQAGNPMTEFLVLTKEEAGSVNIPPSGTHLAPPLAECPVPLVPLGKDEVLVFGSLPGMVGRQVLVANRNEIDAGPEGFTKTDRALLRAIAARLGV